MERRLLDTRDRWRHRDQCMPLRIGSEVPFSLEALQAMRLGGPLPLRAASHPMGAARVTPVDGDRDASNWWRSPGQQSQRERDKELGRPYEADDSCDRAFKRGQWFLLILTICFIAVVVTLLSMVFVRVGHVLDTVGGSSIQAKVDRVLDHAMEAALHTETATANAAEMSALAKNTMQEAHPRLIDALNQSSEMFEELRDFSMHPQWTVSAGSMGRRRRD